MADPVFFDTWFGPMRVVLVGTAAYAALIVMLRLSGKRTLGKMNAFDFVVTIAIGSTLASVLLDDGVPLVDGLVAFALLICLQFAITWASVRSVRIRGLVKAEPTLLVHDGRYLEGPMRRHRVTRDEIDAATRAGGWRATSDAGSVVLETDGSMTVVPRAGTEGTP